MGDGAEPAAALPAPLQPPGPHPGQPRRLPGAAALGAVPGHGHLQGKGVPLARDWGHWGQLQTPALCPQTQGHILPAERINLRHRSFLPTEELGWHREVTRESPITVVSSSLLPFLGKLPWLFLSASSTNPSLVCVGFAFQRVFPKKLEVCGCGVCFPTPSQGGGSLSRAAIGCNLIQIFLEPLFPLPDFPLCSTFLLGHFPFPDSSLCSTFLLGCFPSSKFPLCPRFLLSQIPSPKCPSPKLPAVLQLALGPVFLSQIPSVLHISLGPLFPPPNSPLYRRFLLA